MTYRGLVALALAFALAGLVGPATAQSDDAERTSKETVADFIHYVRIANFDISAGLAGEILGLGLSDVEFVELIDGEGLTSRFDRAIADALRNDRLQPLAAELQRRYRAGKLDLARSPDEIARSIELLTSGLYGKAQARERLLAAGEYAMPQLFEALLQREDIVLRSEVELLLVDMRGQAVTPLTTALPSIAPADQEVVLSILERIGHRQALPAIVEVYGETDVAAVRSAAARAIETLGGDLGASPSGYYATLALAYFDELAEVTSFPEEEVQLLWSYDDGLGLVMQAILTEAYHEAMAMRYAEHAMLLDGGAAGSGIALWLAANFSRETDSPDGYENPAYPSTRPDASYYAVLAGPSVAQSVLSIALDGGDTTLARQAIGAIERTAGSMAMIDPGFDGELSGGLDGTGSPLITALGFADRRVRYDAALAVAASMPRVTFPGAEVVAPTLASMIRDVDERFAVVVTWNDRETHDRIARMLSSEGYTVLPPANGGLRDIRQALAESPGVELAVVVMPGERIEGMVDEIRSTPKLGVAPILAMTGASDVPGLRPRFAFDPTVSVRRSSMSDSEFAETIASLVDDASGPAISAAEAETYIDRAIEGLRNLAIGESRVIPVAEAASQLIDALGATAGERRLRVAEVLAHVEDPTAQVALLDAALDASGRERAAMLDYTTESVKRFGRGIEPRQTRRVLEMLDTTTNPDVGRSVAALAGALGLSINEIAPIILRDSTDRVAVEARDR